MANPTRYEWDHPKTVQRFLSRANLLEEGCECIFFDGAANSSDGKYGWIRFTAKGFPGVSGKSMVYVHRYIYAIVRGPLEPDETIDHICRQHDCVNPYHLQKLSRSEHAVVSNGDRWGDPDPGEWL